MFHLSSHATVLDVQSRLIVQISAGSNMIFHFIIFVVFMFSVSQCHEYLHTKELLAGNKNKMMISWVVEDDLFLFRLSCNTRGYVGLAFSYSDLPLDGFVAGVGDDGDPYVHDLHLDFAGKTNLQKRLNITFL